MNDSMNDARDTVRRFLQTMEARDLETARSFLAPDFSMEFPGGQRFASLEELVQWSATRYRSVRKRYECFDALADGGAVVVYCCGTLSGVWPEGTAFSGIRFIDRFVVRDGRLEDQQVWNDLAEAR